MCSLNPAGLAIQPCLLSTPVHTSAEDTFSGPGFVRGRWSYGTELHSACTWRAYSVKYEFNDLFPVDAVVFHSHACCFLIVPVLSESYWLWMEPAKVCSIQACTSVSAGAGHLAQQPLIPNPYHPSLGVCRCCCKIAKTGVRFFFRRFGILMLGCSGCCHASA